MADISKQSVSGDLEVSRNMAAGGGLTVSGKTELGGRVVVRDWLDAPNIVGAGKGIFPTYEDLYARYPRPTGGWWAVTDMSVDDDGVFSGCVYVAVRGKWVAQTDAAVPLQINVPDVGMSESIEALQGDVIELRSADSTLQANIDKKQDALRHYAENTAGLEYIPESGGEVEAGGVNAVLALGGDAGGGRVKLAGESVFVETSEFSVDADGHTITRKADSKGGSIYLTTPDLIEQRATDITLDAMRRVDETNGGLEHSGVIHAYTTEDDGFTHNGSRVLAARDIYNGLDQTKEGYALDARQGMALQANIDSEADARTSADNALQANIDKKQDALKYYSEDGGSAAVSVGDNNVFVDDVAVSVEAHDFCYNGFTVLTEAQVYNDLDKAQVGYVLDARQGRALQANIDSEASTRLSVDNALQANINSEANERADADNTLQANIDSEADARTSADNTLQANIDKKQDALELYAESGDAASVTAGSFTYNGSEVVTEEELAAHTLTEEEIDAIVECFMFRNVGVICKDELDCLLEGFEFVGLDGLVTKVEAEGDGMVELVAENEEGVATVRGKTTIGCVDEEDVERMFDEVSKE